MKNTKLLIASTRNWCTTSLSRYFSSKNFDCFTISGDRSFGDVNLAYFFWPLRIITNKLNSEYYQSIFNVIECYIFDCIVCLFILFRRPDCCLLWSGMSSNSARLCKFLKIKTCLWVGEEYLRSSQKRNILSIRKYWVKEIDICLDTVDLVLVESNFVLESLPIKVHKKTHVIFSLVSDNFLNPPEIITNSSSRPLRVGIISTSYRKNTKFAIDVLSDIKAKDDCEIHVFGDLTYFKNGPMPKDKIKIVLNKYYDNDEAYINALKMIDIFLFPSISDAGPRSLLEVALLGISVVASKNSIAPDLEKYFPNITALDLTKKLWIDEINSDNFFRFTHEHSKNIKKFQYEQNKRILKVCDKIST